MSEWREEQNKGKKAFREVLMETVEKEKKSVNVWKEKQDNEKKAYTKGVQEQMRERQQDMQDKMIGVL